MSAYFSSFEAISLSSSHSLKLAQSSPAGIIEKWDTSPSRMNSVSPKYTSAYQYTFDPLLAGTSRIAKLWEETIVDDTDSQYSSSAKAFYPIVPSNLISRKNYNYVTCMSLNING